MKTPSKSNYVQVLGRGIIFLVLSSGCASSDKTSLKKDYSRVPEEFSMKEDRQKFEDLRKEIPDDVREENDEYAFVMKMMGEVNERPEKIRDRWNSETRRRRDRFNKINQDERDEFNKRESKSREEFLRDLTKAREKKSKGMSPDDRREFFSEQEASRRDFFASQSDTRREFESQMRQRRSDFDSMMRDRQGDFNSEHRAYSDRFRQWEKDKKEFDNQKKEFDQQKREVSAPGRGSGEPLSAQPIGKGHYDYEKALREFEQIPKGSMTPLGSGPQDGQ